MNNVYPVTSTRRRKGAARGRESNVLHSPYETCTWLFKTITSKVAILMYVAIFSVLGQNVLAQTCATSVTLTPVSSSVCTNANTGTATVSFTVTTSPAGGVSSATVRLYRDGNPLEVATEVAGSTATSVTITDPSAAPGVHNYDVSVLKTGCPNVQSAPQATQVTVYGTPYVAGVQADQTICSGAQPSFDVYVNGPVTGTLSITVYNNQTATSFTVSGVPASSSGTTTITVTPSPAPVQTTSYTITGVAASVGGCTASATTYTHTITVNTQPPVGNINATPSPVCQGGKITFSTNNFGPVGGTYTLTWYKDGLPVCGGAATCTTGQGSIITGQGTLSLTIDNAQPGDAGLYYLEVVSDSSSYAACGGRGASNVLTVVVNPLPTATFTPTSANVCVNSNTILTVNFTGTAPFSLNYTLNGTPQTPITTSNSSYGITVPTGNPGSTQTYSITSVSDANCVNSVNVPSTATFNVSGFTFTPTAATTTVCYGATTSIAVASQGATGTVTYTLGATTKTAVAVGGNATATFTGIPAGTYTLTATNSGCTVTKSVTIGSYGQATVSAVTNSPISCNGGTTSATATITGDAGTYAVNVTNGTYTSTNTVTKGASATTTSFTGLTAGVYTVTSTNTGTGCSVSSSLTVLQPDPIVVSATPGVSMLSCNGQSTTIAASVTGGNTGVFTYTLSGGPTAGTLTSTGGVTFTNVLAGSYTVSVVDSKGCTGSVTGVNITQPNPITGSAAAVNATCNAGTGTVTFTGIAGGTAPYRYSISGGLSGASTATTTTSYNYVNVAPGTYTATVIDANNCTQVLGVVTVTAPAAITASVTAGTIQCNGGTTTVSITNITGGNNSNIVFTLTGPSGSTSLTTAGTATQTSFYPVSAGSYTLTAGNTGCPAQVVGTVTVTEPAPIVVTPSHTPITCVNGTSTVTIAATAGTATLSYQLIDANTSVQFGSTITNNTGSAVYSNVPAGTYNYIVTNTATGCVQQSTPGNPATQIVIDPVSAVTLGTPVIQNVTCFGGSNGSIAIRPSGGASGNYNVTAVGPNGYNRTIAGTSTVTFTGLFAGNYTITVTDGNGCSASSAVSATVGGGTASGTGAPDLILTSSASTNTFPTTGTTVSITYGVSNPSGNAATGVVLRVTKPTPDYTVTLDPGATNWTHSGGNTQYEEFTFANQVSCGTFTPIEVTVIVTRTAAAVGKGSFPITGNVRSSVPDANDADNTRVDRLNAQ